MNRLTPYIIVAVLTGCSTYVQPQHATAPIEHRVQSVHGITQEFSADGTPRFVWCGDCQAPTQKRLAPVRQAEPESKAAVVHFKINSSQIGTDEIAVLQSVLGRVEPSGGVVILHGYTDSNGTAQVNQVLAERRAEAVRAWIAAHTDKKIIFQTSASGKCCYVREPGPSPDNRRVEIYIKEEINNEAIK